MQELVLSNSVCSGDQTQVVRLDSKCLYPLGHSSCGLPMLACPPSFLHSLLPSLFDTRIHCIAQAGLELAILIPQPSGSYNSGHVLPSPANRGFLTSRFVYMRSLTSVLLVSDFFLGTVYPVIICSTS